MHSSLRVAHCLHIRLRSGANASAVAVPEVSYLTYNQGINFVIVLGKYDHRKTNTVGSRNKIDMHSTIVPYVTEEKPRMIY